MILFYKRPATTLQQHEAVYDAIVARLEEHGYTTELARLDPACKSGVQSFFLPCSNRAHQEWAFFATRGTKTGDLKRCAIDPVLFGKTALPVVLTLAANSILVANATPEALDAATEKLRSMSEGRHSEVLMTGLNLSRLGLSQNEVATELYDLVGPQPHMRNKVPGVVKSLRKYGWA